MKNAISRSGYLIEQRVADLFSRNGYLIVPNDNFVDPRTDKTREIDFRADSTDWTKLEGGNIEGIHWTVMGECENNMQPIVLFPYKLQEPSLCVDMIKMYGVPAKIWEDDQYVSLPTFLPLYKSHHYCKTNVATQYCSFIQKQRSHAISDWIATHD